jgi:hypothetical protein
MPIRNANLYPPDWPELSYRIRFGRAKGRCECVGECGLHNRTGGSRRCIELHGEAAKWAKGRVVLTVAHLNHNPADCRDENLKAMCNRCHLRLDTKLHVRNAATTRQKKQEAAGQQRLGLAGAAGEKG